MKGEETIESETKPQKRKAVESSEDSLSSDVDAQEKVEEEKTIESETEGKNDKEDMSILDFLSICLQNELNTKKPRC